MAWTIPTTRLTDDLITSSIWNTDVVDNLLWLKSPTSGVATLSTQITTTSSSFTDATGLSVTMTTNGGNVLCSFTGSISVGAAGVVVSVTLDADGVNQGGTDGLIACIPSTQQNYSFMYMISGLSSGAHTIKLRWKVSSNTATLYAENSVTYSKLKPTLYCVEMG